jgi:hypothetical protein
MHPNVGQRVPFCAMLWAISLSVMREFQIESAPMDVDDFFMENGVDHDGALGIHPGLPFPQGLSKVKPCSVFFLEEIQRRFVFTGFFDAGTNE